ncbi:hypothetical protein [Delftia tsuruhatensis]|nr:hypothetical protein [Delftia tsuruhatensis]
MEQMLDAANAGLIWLLVIAIVVAIIAVLYMVDLRKLFKRLDAENKRRR